MRNLKSIKKIHLLLFAMMIVFIGCKKEEKLTNTDISGNWIVVSFDDNVAHTKVTKTESNTWLFSNNGDISVTFESENLLSGSISGICVTNTYHGTYVLSAGSGILVKDILSTMINTPLWGQMFEVIGSAESYELKGDKLIIYYNQKNNSITLVRK